MHSLSDIAFKQIRENYWLGQYGDLTIVMRKDSGYVNATKLCKDGGKRFDNWLRLESGKELMAECRRHQALQNAQAENLTWKDAAPHIRGAVCIYVQTSNISEEDRLISGSYCHPLLLWRKRSVLLSCLSPNALEEEACFWEEEVCFWEEEAPISRNALEEEACFWEEELTLNSNLNSWKLIPMILPLCSSNVPWMLQLIFVCFN